MDEMLMDDIYNRQNGCKELARVLIIAHELKSHSSNMKSLCSLEAFFGKLIRHKKLFLNISM